MARSLDRIDAQLKALMRNLIIPGELLDDPSALASRRFGLHSQFEEDGIALSLHAAAGTPTRRFVEIGCGTNGGNSGVLAAELGWEGLMVDAETKAVARAKLLNPGAITGVAALVTRENVNSLITEHGFAGEIDQLSIDIDGNDYWILESVTACTPRLLIIEYNSAFGPSARVTVPYTESFVRPLNSDLSRLYFGASISALEQLAREKGYGLVAVEPHGANAFFLADDVATEIPRKRPEEVYRILAKHTVAARDTHLFERFKSAGLPLVKVGGRSSDATAYPAIDARAGDQSEPRATFFKEAGSNTELLGVGTRWGTFIVSTRDQTVGRSLFTRRGRGEMTVLEHAMTLLASFGEPRRPVFVDCGANIGTTTVAALYSFGFERTVSLEPEPSNFRLLKANLALNDLDPHAIVKQVAVSAEAGTLELRIHPTNWGGHEIVTGEEQSLEVPAHSTERVRVKTVTLDQLVEDGTLVPAEVGMLWLDVQGHEGAVLAGAERVLSAGTPVVFEFYPAMLEQAGGLEDVYRLAEKHFQTFVDMRTVARADDGLEANRRSIDELRDLGAFRAADERRFTDVLLLPS